MKIINTSNKPYEFTYNGEHWGPYKPGEIVEFPDEMAIFALHKSAVLDQDPDSMSVGEVIGYQMQDLGSVAKDKIREIVTYECSLVRNGLCDAKPFKRMADLQAEAAGDVTREIHRKMPRG